MFDDKTEQAIANVVANIRGVSDRVIDGLEDEFGTSTAVAKASPNDLQQVDGVGPVIARKISRRTRAARKNPDLHVSEDIYQEPTINRSTSVRGLSNL
jgi:ERCC4-type nuclease